MRFYCYLKRRREVTLCQYVNKKVDHMTVQSGYQKKNTVLLFRELDRGECTTQDRGEHYTKTN